MTRTEWDVGAVDSEVQLHTGVAGRAARMGHRLALTMTEWRATVRLLDGIPTSADLLIDVGSLQLLRSEGGLKPLSTHEVKLIRRNALKSLQADRFPQIRFHAAHIEDVGAGAFLATGDLEIHGKKHTRGIEFRVDDAGASWRLSGQAEVRQTDFGIKPFSLLGGTLKVEDAVTITVEITRAKDATS